MPLVLKAVSFQSASMGEEAERAFDERGGTFGRSKSCDWVLPDPERYISGKHAEVFFQGGRYYVTDTSTNGLILEGQAMPIGKGNSVQLAHGDVLLLGEFRLQVILEEEAGGLGEAQMAESTPHEIEHSDSVDPLVFLPPEAVPSTKEQNACSESQADNSSIAQDHFEIPRVVAHEVAPSVERAHMGEETPSLEPDSPPIIDEHYLDDDNELIPEDWNVTDYEPKHESPSQLDDDSPQDPVSASPAPSAERLRVDFKGMLESEPELPPAQVSESQPEQEPAPLFNNSRQIKPTPVVGANLRQTVEPDGKHARSDGVASVSDSELYEAFFQGLGIQDTSSFDSSVDSMRSYGELLRLMVESLMDLLGARTEFKNEFRLSRTVLKPEENNPLKFSPNVNEALRIFFSPASSAYLGLEASVRDSLIDVKYHQVGLIAGLQAVFQEFSSLMSPERYTAESDGGVKALLQSITQKSRNWEQFCAYCDRLEQESSNGISGHFSDIFAEAYEERVIMLSNIERGPG